MKHSDLKIWNMCPKAVVMPKWLRRIPPFSEFVYCERTYSNNYVSSTWTIVCLLLREPVARASLDCEYCRSVVYVGSDVQNACLIIKTMFCPAFWSDAVRDAVHKFKVHK